jgi:tRNA modification GTPase
MTARGRGAVATVAFRGESGEIDAAGLFRAANGKSLAAQPVNRVAFGSWGEDPAEDVIVCRVAEDRLEIHCHGGEAASERILSQLERLGVERLAWREFIERTDGSFTADVAEALAAATTPRTAAIIAHQSEGPLREALRRLAAADILQDRNETLYAIDRMRRWFAFGLHLTRPWRAVLYGRPNVGKSSLINALVGFERAMVFDQPGTTRDVVTAETAFDGWPVRLSDTAGLRTDAGELEAAGIERAKAEVAEADLRVLVLDRSQPPEQDDHTGLAEVCLDLVVANKADLSDGWGDGLPLEAIAVSAKTGEGVRELMTRITAALVPSVPANDEPVPVSTRQIEALNAARSALVNGDVGTFRQAIGSVAPRNDGL